MVFPDTTSLLLFTVCAVVRIVIPGPAVFCIVARSVAQGPLAGLVCAPGVGLGATVHVAAAALGVGTALVGAGDEPNH